MRVVVAVREDTQRGDESICPRFNDFRRGLQ